MTTLHRTSVLKEPEGFWFHGGAVTYATAGYLFGLVGLLHYSWVINGLSTLLLGHAMIIAAYVIHECAHNTIFAKNKHNGALGDFLTWICGVPYCTYEDIRHKHFRHHVDNGDIAWYVLRGFGKQHPHLLKLILFLEWFYIPAHEGVQHVLMCYAPFIITQRHSQRVRCVVITVARLGLYAALVYVNWTAALLYLVAYAIMIHTLRFMDGLQHDYGAEPVMYTDTIMPRRGDTVWEQEHTYTNLHSLKFPLFNWFTLNFGYHNAHHHRPTAPWYRLPALHKSLTDNNPERVIPLGAQLEMYHRHRVDRIRERGPAPSGDEFLLAAQRGQVQGGNGASFLVSF